MRVFHPERLLVGALLFASAGCASGPSHAPDSALARGDIAAALSAYERDPGDPETLRAIALAVVLREGYSRDPARAARAVSVLAGAGGRGDRPLQNLAAHAALPETRVRALAALRARGDAGAGQALRARIDDADPAVQALAVSALDAATDAPLLRQLAQAPAASVRRAALERLQRAPAELDTRVVLVRAARVDPAVPVRLAALRALAAQGPEAIDAIEARLEDPEQAVRLCAIGELVRADPARAVRRLSELLAGEPTAEGIEAARTLLAVAGTRAPESAIAHLSRALAARDNALRGAAAVALMSTRDARTEELALAHAPAEPVRSVRLCLSLASAEARRAQLLRPLITARDAVAGQAAAELARAGDAQALRVLRALLDDADATVRAVAVDGLGRELGRPEAVRAQLRDRDPGVRLRAAAAILGG